MDKITVTIGSQTYRCVPLVKPQSLAEHLEGYEESKQPGHITDGSVEVARRYGIMTGQEWYDRFVSEWDRQCKTIGSVPVSEELPYLYGRIAADSAKRASELE